MQSWPIPDNNLSGEAAIFARAHDNIHIFPSTQSVCGKFGVRVWTVGITILLGYQWGQSVTICLDIYIRLLDTFLVPKTERQLYLNECLLQHCLTLILCSYVNPITLGI